MELDPAAWPLHDARARDNELPETCLSDGPQTMIRRGTPESVIVSLDQQPQCSTAALALKDLLLADENRFDVELQVRGQGNHRGVEAA